MKKNSLKQLKIMGVKVNSTSRHQVLKVVHASLKNKKKLFITTPNPEIILQATKDDKLLEALNASDIALADGHGLKLAYPGLQIIHGREIFENLLEVANGQKLKVYLLGATPDVNQKALAKIKKLYPKIKARGSGDILVDNEAYSVTEKDVNIHIEIVNHINKFKPDFLFVALGAPKQEKWIFNNFDYLNFKMAMTIGGALDYFTGKMAKPPDWISRSALEWLWRVGQNPRRIKRIINAVFVFPLILFLRKARS